MNVAAIALLEEYVTGRQAEQALLRQVRALRCAEYRRAFVGGAADSPDAGSDGEPACYQTGDPDVSKWCDICQERDPLFRQMVARKRANRKLLRRLEKAALKQPAAQQPDAPGPLLELMARTETLL